MSVSSFGTLPRNGLPYTHGHTATTVANGSYTGREHGEPDRPLGELFSELANETGTLVRKEFELAQAELRAKAVKGARQAALIATGGVVAVAGTLALLTALIAGLAEAMPVWAAALLVAIVAFAASAALVVRGLAALKNIDPVPQRTVQTLKDNQLWLKEQLR
jgi:hypothetical protein